MNEKEGKAMISVIVPVFKVAPYLRQCVDSILKQTYRDIEILLIDDGSPDECGEICEEYKEQDKRIRVFHTEHRGLSAARNIGLKAAIGEYIGFVDSDDWIEPKMYEVLLREIKKKDVSVCGYDYSVQKTAFIDSLYCGSDAMRALLDKKFNNNVWNKLYRKDLFNDVLFPEGRNYEDVAIMHMIVDRAKSVVVISDILYHYRERPESITKIYTAKNLMDYADARLSRYYYFRNECHELFEEEKDELLLFAANGISKVWRWWYGCSSVEKESYKDRIKEFKAFTEENIPIFGLQSWPFSMRLSSVFMHSQRPVSLAVLYGLNQMFIKLRPRERNVVLNRGMQNEN